MSDDTTEMYPDHDARYEKNVENLFSLWLQGLYVKRQVSENWEPIVSEIARKAQQEGIAKSDVRKLVRGQVLDLVGNAMQHPRYIQMAGTLEYGLGDAIAQSDTHKLMLIETKSKLPLSTSAKAREMDPPDKDGKGRRATFAVLEEAYWEAYSLSRSCHFLVGVDDDNTLNFQPFLELCSGNGSGNIKPIDKLNDGSLGIDAERLADYLFALLKAHESGSDAGKAEWLVSEVVLLDYREALDCRAHRILVTELCAVLFNKYGNDAMKEWVKTTYPRRQRIPGMGTSG